MDKIEYNKLEFPYISRDLSWVDFNERVMNEGLRKETPLLERLRFLSIVSTNFDEFFMVRVAALKRLQKAEAGRAVDPSGLTPDQQLKAISQKVHDIMNRQYECLRNEIFPGLAKNGLSLLRPDSWTVPQLDFLNSFFLSHIYPVLTPLRLEDDKPMPFIESRLLNAVFLLEPENPNPPQGFEFETAAALKELKVIIPLPGVLDRLVWMPSFEAEHTNGEKEKFQLALLEDVIVTWGAYLFPGFKIKESMLFKINRDADFSVDEQRDEDFVSAMVEVLEGRGRSDCIRMVYSPGSVLLKEDLAKRFSLDNDFLYEVDGPINPVDFMELSGVASMEDLTEKPWKIHKPLVFNEDTLIWDQISQGDIMLHLPYQSFDPVVRFFQEAAVDPQVISIRTALYRTGGAIPGIGQSIEKVDEWFEQIKKEQGNSHIRLGIFLNNGTIIGDIALQDIDNKNRSCSIGMGMSKLEYRNKGYGKEAVKLLLEYGFNNYGLERITASTLETNISAQKSVEKLGFKLEGKERKAIYFAGKKYDRYIYGILVEEYINKNI